MSDEQKFPLAFTSAQMDFVGKLVVDNLNAASAQARMANEVYTLLRGAVQAAQPPVANGAPAAKAVVDAPGSPPPQ